ncbi:MAG: hypothetical protein ACTHLZ_19655, partial [Tepidisphaeraceae bacterium]
FGAHWLALGLVYLIWRVILVPLPIIRVIGLGFYFSIRKNGRHLKGTGRRNSIHSERSRVAVRGMARY